VPVAPPTIPSNRTRAAASVVRTATAAVSVALPAYVWLPGVVTFAPSVTAGEPMSTPPAADEIPLEITVVSIVEATVSGSVIACAPVAGSSSRSTPVEPVAVIDVVDATENVPTETLFVLRTV